MISPNWELDFHVFVDVSYVAIGSVLMQEQLAGWFCLVYYASHGLSANREELFYHRERMFGDDIFNQEVLAGSSFMWIIWLFYIWCDNKI